MGRLRPPSQIGPGQIKSLSIVRELERHVVGLRVPRTRVELKQNLYLGCSVPAPCSPVNFESVVGLRIPF